MIYLSKEPVCDRVPSFGEVLAVAEGRIPEPPECEAGKPQACFREALGLRFHTINVDT